MREGSVKDMAIRPKSIVPIIGEPDIDESYIRQQDFPLFMLPLEFKPIETNFEISGGRNDIA